MSDRDASSPTRSGAILAAIALLVAAHFPILFSYYEGLWKREHYEFFPFALITFAWLLYTRRHPTEISWDLYNTSLVVLDIACLGVAIKMNSPWLAAIGFMMTLFAVCRAFQDRDRATSLWYLFMLPVITLRPPLSSDVKLINWLQEVTTGSASQLLNFFGVLHVRMGNILKLPGKNFMVEEACSGVQSLFTLLFLATLIICGYRRTMLHAIAVLISAVCLAGIMNIFRVCAVTIAWSGFGTDISSGWEHDTVGYVALVLAAILVLSADALFEFLLQPAPDTEDTGAVLKNPINGIWNWLFYRPMRVDDGDELPEQAWMAYGTVILTAAATIFLGSMAMQFSMF